jgi:DNA-binding XRE family transcriptional regulator
MAKLTDEIKDKIVSDFHIGKSQNFLANKYELSPATINKLCKGLTPKYKDKVNIASSIESEVLQESEYLVNAFKNEVKDKTHYLQLFQNSALKNQQKANDLLELTDDMKDIESHARITKTNKETVLGKDPETVINNANVQQINEVIVEII